MRPAGLHFIYAGRGGSQTRPYETLSERQRIREHGYRPLQKRGGSWPPRPSVLFVLFVGLWWYILALVLLPFLKIGFDVRLADSLLLARFGGGAAGVGVIQRFRAVGLNGLLGVGFRHLTGGRPLDDLDREAHPPQRDRIIVLERPRNTTASPSTSRPSGSAAGASP